MILERHRRGLIGGTCLLCFLLLPSALVDADSVPGKSQPDRLGFGSVRIHATVEGSILVFTDAEESAQLSCDVQPPPFVKITKIQRGTMTGGSGGTKSTFYVYVAVVTDQTGEYAGTITEKVGSRRTTIPVNVQVLAPEASTTRVLIVSTPFNCSSTGDATVFDPWLRLVESAKLAPDYLEVLRNQPVLRQLDLSTYDVILLGEYGLLRLQDADIAKLKQFVNNGGRLLVCANHFFRGTVEMANRLLVLAGLEMTDTEPIGIKDAVALSGKEIIEDPLTRNVRTVKYLRASPVAVTDKSKGRILIYASPYPGAGFLAAGRHGKGQIIALSQSLWWNWIGDAKFKDCDNPQLLLNLVAKTAE